MVKGGLNGYALNGPVPFPYIFLTSQSNIVVG